MQIKGISASTTRWKVDVQIGSRIRQRRVDLGRSDAMLASDMGGTVDRVAAIEAGTSRPSANELYEIAKALRIPISYFFDVTPPST